MTQADKSHRVRGANPCKGEERVVTELVQDILVALLVVDLESIAVGRLGEEGIEPCDACWRRCGALNLHPAPLGAPQVGTGVTTHLRKQARVLTEGHLDAPNRLERRWSEHKACGLDAA